MTITKDTYMIPNFVYLSISYKVKVVEGTGTLGSKNHTLFLDSYLYISSPMYSWDIINIGSRRVTFPDSCY